MFIDESLWIKSNLSQLYLPPRSRILDIGSSTTDFRATQPHITENVYRPLNERGFDIIHFDARPGNGVDIVGDIENPDIIEQIGEKFNLVLCANLLEHVSNVESTVGNVINLVCKDGYLLLTAPNKYPRHDDPIDTMYRPSDRELQELASRHAAITIIASEILDIRNHIYYFYESRYPFWGYRKFRFWRYYFNRFRWKQSCLLLRVH